MINSATRLLAGTRIKQTTRDIEFITDTGSVLFVNNGKGGVNILVKEKGGDSWVMRLNGREVSRMSYYLDSLL